MGERLAAEARAAAGAIRGLIARPDGPLACALVLAAASLVETFLYTNSGSERTSALLINLAATLPLALARRRPLVSAVVITAAVMMMIADVGPLTVSAFLALDRKSVV